MEVFVDFTNFTAGEGSARMKGRVDVAKYYNMADTELNMISQPQGGATRRPPTLYVTNALDQTATLGRVKLQGFVFNTLQAYPQEFGQYAAALTVKVTGAADNTGGLIRVTLQQTAGLTDGSSVVIAGVTGTTEANGTWKILWVDQTHVDLIGSAFVNAYVSGGTATYSCGYMRPKMNDGVIANATAVTGAANNGSGLIRLAVAGTAGMYTGNSTTVTGVTGTTEANGTWPITVVDSTHIDLQGSAFVHAYVSGGSASTIVELPVPYLAADMAALSFVQSADTQFVQCANSNYPPGTVTRTAHTNWQHQTLLLNDGPFLSLNATTTTLSPSAATGKITVTASATAGINGNLGFQTGDEGRYIRIKASAKWGVVRIMKVTDSTHAVCLVVAIAAPNGADGTLDGSGSGVTTWQMGAWSIGQGWPFIAGFFQQRLTFVGYSSQPNAVYSTTTSGFGPTALYFSPTDDTGAVLATSGLAFIISDNQVNAGRWISAAGSATSQQLGIGTSGSEQIMQPATQTQALSGTNIQVYPETTYGSAPNVGALRIGKAVIFADLPGRKLREWNFNWQVNGYIGPDLTQYSEHITRSGIIQTAYQPSPNQVIWAVLANGGLIAFTYDREQQVFAPSRQQLGGQWYGGPPLVESICVIPSPDGTYSELWLSVLRTIGGTPKRFIEVMRPYFDAGVMSQDDGWFADAASVSALTFPAAILTPPVLTNVNASQPTMPALYTGTGNFTATAAVFAGTSADVGKILRLNGGKAIVTAAVSTTVVTAQVLTNYPLNNLAPAAANAWSFTGLITTASGLAYLNGETAAIVGDGAAYPQQPVSGGAVSLGTTGASFVAVGLPYTPILVTMPFTPQSGIGAAAQGKIKRADHAYIRFIESMGCSYGVRQTDPMTNAVKDKLQPLQNRFASGAAGQAPALYTGIQRVPLPGGHDREAQIIITQPDPLPLTIAAVGVVADVGAA